MRTTNAAKPVLLACATVLAGSLALVAAGLFILRRPPHMPSEREAARVFAERQPALEKLARRLENEGGELHLARDGTLSLGTPRRVVPAYGELMREVGAQFATLRADGSREFTLWGDGGAISPNSYMGFRYCPESARLGARPGWRPAEVASLGDAALPQENGHVAAGLYVVRLEGRWSLFRFKYPD